MFPSILDTSAVYGSFLIPADAVPRIEAAVTKLAKRITAGKTVADIAPAVIAKRDHFVPRRDGGADPYSWVTLLYAMPRVEGWTLQAVYDWERAPDGSVTCYTSNVPGVSVPESLRTVEAGRCDHCGIKRDRKRPC